MDCRKECFAEHGGTFAEKLQEVGFSAEQAGQFLRKTESGIMAGMQNTGVENMMATLLSEEPSQLSKLIKVEAIANKLGVNHYQVTTGHEAITPLMCKALSQKNNDLAGGGAASLA